MCTLAENLYIGQNFATQLEVATCTKFAHWTKFATQIEVALHSVAPRSVAPQTELATEQTLRVQNHMLPLTKWQVRFPLYQL